MTNKEIESNPLLLSADTIARRNRADIFIGVVAPTGIRRETLQAHLTTTLNRFGYGLEFWRVSDFIELFKNAVIDDLSPSQYLESVMEAGSTLRNDIGPDCLARAVMLAINTKRREQEQTRQEGGDGAEAEQPRVHLIWSLKHEEEVATLRLAYGASFHLLGLYAMREERNSLLLERPA